MLMVFFIATTAFITSSYLSATIHGKLYQKMKKKAIIKEHRYHHSLLNDFNYTDIINMGKQGVSSGDCMVSM